MTLTATERSHAHKANAHTATSQAPAVRREAAPLKVLMCRPEYFTVEYTINPWMDRTPGR